MLSMGTSTTSMVKITRKQDFPFAPIHWQWEMIFYWIIERRSRDNWEIHGNSRSPWGFDMWHGSSNKCNGYLCIIPSPIQIKQPSETPCSSGGWSHYSGGVGKMNGDGITGSSYEYCGQCLETIQPVSICVLSTLCWGGSLKHLKPRGKVKSPSWSMMIYVKRFYSWKPMFTLRFWFVSKRQTRPTLWGSSSHQALVIF